MLAREAVLGTAKALWRYPVSSLGGEVRDRLTLGPDGVAGDRTHGLFDPATGGTALPGHATRWAPAALLSARSGAEGPELLTDAGWVSAASATAQAGLAACLGFPMTVRPHGPGGTPRRYAPHALHLVTTGGLDWLAARVGQAEADPRRFRPNILVDAPGDRPERGWIGRRLEVGGAVIEVYKATRRCGYVILPQEGLSNTPELLRHLRRDNDLSFGVYACVVAPGEVCTGDSVRLLS